MHHLISITGRATKDCEMRFIPSGKAVSTFTVAVNDGFGEHKKTIWFKVTVWDKLAETCNNFVKRGKIVQVVGKLNPGDDGNPRTWEDKEGETHGSYDITAREIVFLSSREEVTTSSDSDNQSLPIDDDQIPF